MLVTISLLLVLLILFDLNCVFGADVRNLNRAGTRGVLDTISTESEAATNSVESITKEGWTRDAAMAALENCSGNVTLSLIFLQEQEEYLEAEYFKAVDAMVRSSLIF